MNLKQLAGLVAKLEQARGPRLCSHCRDWTDLIYIINEGDPLPPEATRWPCPKCGRRPSRPCGIRFIEVGRHPDSRDEAETDSGPLVSAPTA